MEQWLLIVLGILVGIAIGIFWGNAITRRVEGFETALAAYKASPAYKKQLGALVDLYDSKSGGRRDIQDMLTSPVVNDMPEAEQCLVNFHVLATRFTGYIGPFMDGFFDIENSITYALKAGCRAFIYEIDYLESCIGKSDEYDYYPKLIVRDVQGKIVSRGETSKPMCNSDGASNIKSASTVLRSTAFSSIVQNQNDPLIVILYLLRIPPKEKTGNKRLLTYYSRIAKGLEPLFDKSADSIVTGGTFARQKQEGTLLINPLKSYMGRALFFCNADTSGFRSATGYAPNEDLDYIVNLRLSFKQTQLGCTSNQSGGSYGGVETVESYMSVPPSQLDNTCDDTKLRWTVCLSQDPAKQPSEKNYTTLTGEIGVHCIPIQIWNKENAYMFTDSRFKKWSFIPKIKSLRYIKPPVVVPAKQVIEADAKGGNLRTPMMGT